MSVTAESVVRDIPIGKKRELAALKIEINRAYADDEFDTATQLMEDYERIRSGITGVPMPRYLSPPNAGEPLSTIQGSIDIRRTTTASQASHGLDSSAASPKRGTEGQQEQTPVVAGHAQATDPEGSIGEDCAKKYEHAGETEHMSWIMEGIWLGDINAALDGENLAAGNVTHVVDLANSAHDHHHIHGNSNNCHYVVEKDDGDWKDDTPSIREKLVVRVDDVDNAPLDEHFDAINDFVDKALELNEGVLIHCFRGKSRSATSVIQYLMYRRNMLLKDALKITKERRPVIQLNVGFKKMLMELEEKLFPDQAPSIKLKLKSRKPVLSSSRTKRQPPNMKTATAAESEAEP